MMMFAILPLEAQQNKPNYKTITDSLAMKYCLDGVFENGILTLSTTADYDSLNAGTKKETLKVFAREFSNCQIIVKTQNNGREMWLSQDGEMECVDKWDASNMNISAYLPVSGNLNPSGGWFYSISGTYSGSEMLSRGALNFRCGTFLYKTKWDVAVTSNIGYSKSWGETLKLLDIGIDSRAYLPFRIKKINMAPYAGTGVSWIIKPDSHFEWRLLAGGCLFVGPGSLDIGLQYGTQTGFTFTIGYTFRPRMLGTNNKK